MKLPDTKVRQTEIFIILPAILICAIIPLSAQVIVNEVMSNAPGRDSGTGSPGDRMEYVELLNTSRAGSVDLSGWTLSDGDAVDSILEWDRKAGESVGSHDVISGSTVLEAGRFAVIFDPEYFQEGEGGWYELGGGTLVLTVGNTTLGNGISVGDPLVICNADGDTVSTFGTPLLDDDFPSDPGDGLSWERIDPTNGDTDGNWCISTDPSGSTPGRVNSNSMPVNISMAESVLTVRPDEPGEREVIELRGFAYNRGLHSTPPFETLFFLDLDGDGNVEEDEVLERSIVVEPIEPGDSREVRGELRACGPGYFTLGILACHPEDGNASDDKVSREIRVGDVPPRIVINEIYFYPTAGEEEWVEIFNRSSEPVDLDGWILADNRKAGEVRGNDLVIGAGSFALLAGDSSSLLRDRPELARVKVIETEPFPSLANDGDTLTITASGGYRSDRVEYDGDWGGRRGVSLERVSPFDPSPGPSNWGSSVEPSGSTPGKKNSIFQAGGGSESLLSVDPNVFSPDGDGRDDRTVISYRLSVPKARVLIEVYNLLGSRVRVVLDQEESGSEGLVVWDGKDNRGRVLPAGIYVIYMEAIDPYSGYLLRRKVDVVLGGRL